jgi:dual specificity phosphatase 12
MMAADEPDQVKVPPPIPNDQSFMDAEESCQKLLKRAQKLRELQDPSMAEIESGLFIGNGKSSYNRDLLSSNHINAIVSLTSDGYSLWYSTTRDYVPYDRHKRVPCLDSSTQDLLVHLDDICDFIDRMSVPIQSTQLLSIPQQAQIEVTELDADKTSSSIAPGVVLVHCGLGISRSATVVVAYLMRKYNMKLEDALAMTKTKRKVKPSDNFMRQLGIWEQVGYQIWEDSERKKPKAQYQAYLNDRAIILKSKGLTGDEPIGIQSL